MELLQKAANMWNDTSLVFPRYSFLAGNLCIFSENRLTHTHTQKKNHIYKYLQVYVLALQDQEQRIHYTYESGGNPLAI